LPGFAGKYRRTTTTIPVQDNSEKTICQAKSRSSKHPLPTDVDTPAVLELRAIERLNNWQPTFNE
jgi:hypothetical protein